MNQFNEPVPMNSKKNSTQSAVSIRKRKDLSVTEKLELLEQYDSCGSVSQREAAAKLGISQPLLCKLLKSRDELKEINYGHKNFSRKRERR